MTGLPLILAQEEGAGDALIRPIPGLMIWTIVTFAIVFWIGPNANFLSTKKVIAKQTIVQIISPGTTSISGEAATGRADAVTVII